MSGVLRKIELARQLEEARRTREEPPVAATRKEGDDRLARRRAIVSTLELLQDSEHLFRAFMAERRGEGLRIRIIRGQVCWALAEGEDWNPFTADEANIVLARFDAPAATQGAGT